MLRRRARVYRPSLWLLGSGVLSCSGAISDGVTPPGAPVASIALSAAPTSFKVGQTSQVTATAKDQTGATVAASITFASTPATVATISASGLVSGVGIGSATISATSGSVTQTLSLSVVDSATIAGLTAPPELPRIYLNTAAPSAPDAGGRIISVGSGGNLQAALDAAAPGDVVELAAGATFVGNFVLPNKNTTSAKWIVIRPSNYASLPAEGTRMTPTMAASLNLPKIQASNTVNVIATALGAHHYRLVGLEVSVTPSNTYSYGLLAFDGGQNQTTLAVVPHDLVADRLYIHGSATGQLRRCVVLNSASTAIIDSWLSDCHEGGADSQAIGGWNAAGPFKIVNNHLEGAGENLILGGADPSVPNMTPSDIEIRGNHFYKPASWKGGPWLIKNLLELKHAQRVLIEGNVLENSWTNGQNGVAVALKTVNQNGSCTWCVTQDVTIRNNIIRNVGAGFNIASSPDNNFVDIHARRILVSHNIVWGINVAPFDGDGRGVLLLGDLLDVEISHNTMFSSTPGALVFGPYNSNSTHTTVRDNLWHGGLYGVLGDNLLGGPAIRYYMPDGIFVGNVMVYASGGSGYPSGNYFPATVAPIGFVDFATGDFHLNSSSPYKAKASDGTDPGANVDAVLAATRTAVVAP